MLADGLPSRGRRGGRRGGQGGGPRLVAAPWVSSGGGERNGSTAEWISDMVTAIVQNNGELFSDLIRERERLIPDHEIRSMPETVMSAIPHNKLREAGLLKGDSLYKKLLQEFLRLRQLQARHPVRWSEVVKQCIALLDIYIDVYVDPNLESCGWLVPGLAALCSIMNKAAYAADNSQDETADFMDDEDVPEDEETQNKYTKEVLNAIRPKLGKVRGDEERHGAYIVLLGQSIKRCLQLGNMQMAAGFLKLCDSKQINFSRVPRGPIVNFRYYLGKLYMQQEQFEQAEAELVWAFTHCPEANINVRRNILECLIPVRLRMGKVPPLELLRKYRMEHYVQIISSMKTGNVSSFDKTMEIHERILINHGTILCVERIKFIVYRTLMKHVKEWWLKSGLASKPNIVPISAFSTALKWQSDSLFDDDEMACISANLIRMGYIKGYISWEHMVIVFSNQNPFPSLRTMRPS
ncbi:PCI domain-containing protein [Toxoplasma gondii TgCatPRC2]|uniref:PCI domain-containing protein n=13 Tax=Toxoplasma gondii TaxID=5811 RepID=A0A125YMP6_TOXGV|nr:PCI domain-containing protein [Toxoplasma gondii ME49]EPR62542.1 PCI domain-containing protein [Toxoplasma gondii GT1]ESS31828.1 PCI domain-containing protein [Toxoplasma gondii VEG]KAF4640898.1 PCI domain-containing protein [Toxoplasma gondii]KFG30766.1 PCI domain-containing protein [Toxoplasma gondii GAB2-2007-GAL-DOM2]KFG34637.1 PCI domain-containing protein [Toxoplasma gondii p89]KFG52290.1 PCI domain-containing protein [Toxoplasma gondii FOU]KFG57221.1 PCI domain-containing protein [|eukprot:XP_018637185.1 PCI domain-containing protein [Toxoplasma gondii ME49]